MTRLAERHPLGKDPKRCFDKRQRARMLRRSGRRCEVSGCRRQLDDGEVWIAGHWPVPHALGGRTILRNSRVECSHCIAGTHKEDTGRVAKARRQARETGQQARRVRNGSQIRSRGFDKRFSKRMSGEVVPRKPKKEHDNARTI